MSGMPTPIGGSAMAGRMDDGSDRRSAGDEPTEHERSLLDAIADGDLDEHLTALADAIHARQRLLHTVRSATVLATLCAGDHVRVNQAVSPRYLAGLRGTVVDVDDRAATIQLARPVGRFRSGVVRCPALALDRLGGRPRT